MGTTGDTARRRLGPAVVAAVLLVTGCSAEPPRHPAPRAVTLHERDAVLVEGGRGADPVATMAVPSGGRGVQPRALTADGQLLLSLPHSGTDPRPGLALLDPASGRRDLLPAGHAAATVREAGERTLRLATLDDRPKLLTFDRRTRVWTTTPLTASPALRKALVQPVTVAVAGDGRVYVQTSGSVEERATLWSFPLRHPAQARREATTAPGLVAAGDLVAYADPLGGSTRVLHLRTLSSHRQRDIQLPCRADHVYGSAGVVVVRLSCPNQRHTTNLVLSPRGTVLARLVLPDDSFVTQVTDRFVMLVGSFAFDVRRRRLLRLSDYHYELDGWPQVDGTGRLLGYVDGRRLGLHQRLHVVRLPK